MTAARDGRGSRSRRRIRSRLMWGLVRSLAARTGNDLVARNYYSPLPDVDRLPASLWAGPHPVRGVDLRLDSAAQLLEELAPWLAEFAPPLDEPTGGSQFFVRNGSYGSVDAEILYAIIRRFKPARVLELGSGASSHVVRAAGASNARDGKPLEHLICDPFPFEANPMGPLERVSITRVGAELLDSSQVTALQLDDVMFVDTTHTVKTGGEVTRIILDLLPQLSPGVLVHLHDVFLPYEYPRAWVVNERRAWAEQYLLQAFMAFNDAFEVVFPAHAVARAFPARVAELIPSFTPGVAPGAFWIRRRLESSRSVF